MPARDLSNAVASYVRSMSQSTAPGSPARTTSAVGIWLGAEAVDSNLSIVQIAGGTVVRFVPKLGGLSFSSGDTVKLDQGSNTPYIIAGKTVGNTALATNAPDLVAPSAPSSVSVGSPTATTLTVSWSGASDNVGIAGYTVYSSTGQALADTNALTTSVVIKNLTPNTSYSFTVRSRDYYQNASPMSASASNTTLPASALPSGLYTYTYYATWGGSYNFYGTNEYNDILGNKLSQGRFDGGNTCSMMGFDYAKIASDTAGTTPQSASVTLTYAEWYSSDNLGTAVVGTHAATSRPATFSGTPDLAELANWLQGNRLSVPLGSTVAAALCSGAAKGLALGPAPAGLVTYAGYAYGPNSGINSPLLTVTVLR